MMQIPAVCLYFDNNFYFDPGSGAKNCNQHVYTCLYICLSHIWNRWARIKDDAVFCQDRQVAEPGIKSAVSDYILFSILLFIIYLFLLIFILLSFILFSTNV